VKDWFLALEKRERMFVVAGGVAALVMVIWGLVLAPVYSATAAAERRIETKQATLSFLRNAAAEIASHGGDAAVARPDLSGQSLVVVVDRSARQAGLGQALTRNQPVGDDGIRVRLDNAPFDALARWLAQLNVGAGLAIESASFDRTPEEGRVNASLVLRQGLQ
jgi:general secretion pathway protein M